MFVTILSPPPPSGFPRGWYRWRWAATYPLQWQLPGGFLTLGELLLLLLAVGAAAGAMAGTWQDASASGVLASIPLFLTLMLPTRNSVWSFLLGLPFERALAWHAVAAYLTVAMGAYHGVMSW